MGVSKVLILNADDSEYKFFDQFVADRKLTYGLHSAAISALDIVERADGNNFKIKLSNDSVDLDLHLPGRFNVYNALAAASIGICHECSNRTNKGRTGKSASWLMGVSKKLIVVRLLM